MHATRSRLIVAVFLPLLIGSCEGSGSSGLIRDSSELKLPNEEIVSGGSSRSLLLDDLNKDGVLDLVTIPDNQNRLSVLLGTTDGLSVSGPFFLYVGGTPRSVAAADVDRDGNLDLITAVQPTDELKDQQGGDERDVTDESGLVLLFLGDRNGSFRPGARIVVPPMPRMAVITDLNEDGFLDIVLLHDSSNELSVLEGRGAGTFETRDQPVNVGDKTPFASSLTVGDLDQDGSPDFVTTNNAREVIVRLGSGVDLIRCRITGTDPRTLAIADINSDGIPDVVTANEGSADVSLLFGIGDGSLEGCSVDEPRLLVGNFPNSIAVGDVNRDGLPDIVTANSQHDTVSVLIRKRDTNEELFGRQLVFPIGGFPSRLALADVDGDSILDIVTGDRFLPNATVLVGIGDGRFSAQDRIDIGLRRKGRLMPVAIATADLNADGTLDLVTANVESNNVSILLNRGNGSFCLEGTLAVGVSPIALALDDLDKDGFPDLVAINRGSNEAFVLLGRSGESNSSHECEDLPRPAFDSTNRSNDLGQSYQIGNFATALAVFDVNSDGTLDLIITAAGSEELEADTISILLGSGDGTFSMLPPIEASGSPHSVAVADLNMDEVPDLITANKESDDVSIFLGSSDDQFLLTSTITVGSEPVSVVAADLNQDGFQDMVVANYGADSVSTLFGRGDGAFAAPETLAVGCNPKSVSVADANADGLMDLVVVNQGSSDVSVLLGRGGTFFATQRLFRTDLAPQAAVVADFNADGAPDLAVANSTAPFQVRGPEISIRTDSEVGNVSILIAR